jgi:hypothetical protein
MAPQLQQCSRETNTDTGTRSQSTTNRNRTTQEKRGILMGTWCGERNVEVEKCKDCDVLEFSVCKRFKEGLERFHEVDV